MKTIINGDQVSFNCVQYLRKLNSLDINCQIGKDIIFSNFTQDEVCKFLNKNGPVKNDNIVGVYKPIDGKIFLEYPDGEIFRICKDSD